MPDPLSRKITDLPLTPARTLPKRVVPRERLARRDTIDGDAREAVRLQRPLGVHASNGLLYVTDTYNHKVKVISPGTRSASTLFGTGRPREVLTLRLSGR